MTNQILHCHNFLDLGPSIPHEDLIRLNRNCMLELSSKVGSGQVLIRKVRLVRRFDYGRRFTFDVGDREYEDYFLDHYSISWRLRYVS